MKLLFAYDGSHCSEAALDDLARAGLPSAGEALIATVAEVWLPPPGSTNEETESEWLRDAVARHRQKGERLMNEAEMRARHAAARFRTMLPGWTVSHSTTYGSPAWEILSLADEARADLIVLGSHGHSVIGRFILGSVSQKVMTEAACSVRIARGRIDVEPSNPRVIIGYDGSKGADAAVAAVSLRAWPVGSEVTLVTATDRLAPTAIDRFSAPANPGTGVKLEEEYSWIRTPLAAAGEKLSAAGLAVHTEIVEGDPNTVLVRKAENWHADCIFVGANAWGSRLQRFLLGSTSAAVVARAHCSVEVVRWRESDEGIDSN